MSKLEELISELCPDGVEFVCLSDVCEISSAGVDKKIVKDEQPVRLLNYMDIYRNRHITHETLTMKVTAPISKVKNCNIKKGDIFITPTSETINDIGHAAIAIEPIDGGVYSYHLMRLRLKEFDMTTAFYICYVFASGALQTQILHLATGLTRFGLSKGNWEKVRVPLPPLPVQREIVRILDNFTELTARKKQYEYYRDSLLAFDDEIPMVSLGEFATIIRGGSFQKKDFVESGVPCIHYGQIYTKYGLSATKTITFINQSVAIKSKFASKNDVVMAVTSENVEDVCKCVVWLGEKDVAISGHTAIIKHNQNPKFLAYYFQTAMFFGDKIKLAHGTKVVEVTPSKLADIKIPLPSLAEQQRIVAILDRFDTLCNDISSGLPAEIKARQQQYEYYRDKLLTFKEKSSI